MTPTESRSLREFVNNTFFKYFEKRHYFKILRCLAFTRHSLLDQLVLHPYMLWCVRQKYPISKFMLSYNMRKYSSDNFTHPHYCCIVVDPSDGNCESVCDCFGVLFGLSNKPLS